MLLRCIIIQRISLLTYFFSATFLSIALLLTPGVISSGKGQGVMQSGAKASLPSTNSVVETPSDTFLLDFNKDIVDQILPFDSLYKLALKNSPVLKFERANGESEKANYNLSKIVILKNVYPFLNYANGTQSLASNGTLVSDLSQIINGYRYGINVQIPFDELIGRRSKMRQAAASYRAVLARREIEELNLKREMIKSYQDMLTSQRILRVRYRDEQTSGMAFQVAEVELKQGKIEPRELAQISNFYAQAKSATEYQSGEFLKHFYDLQALVGVPLQYLQMSTKVLPILPPSEQMPVNVLPATSKPESKKPESKKKP